MEMLITTTKFLAFILAIICKMKKFVNFILFFPAMLLLLSSFSFAQGLFSDQIIIMQPDANGAYSVYAADLDGDGDPDVLSASLEDNKIAWYENHDGRGSFGSQQVVTTSADGANAVYAEDLDGDGDVDVLSASSNDDKIAWYENRDGRGSFSSQQVITTSANGAESVFTADLDGDGDMDVLSASWQDDKIAWYENRDGRGKFGSQQVITNSADHARSVYAADLDGDGDPDVLSASIADDKIAWYENRDGRGKFGPQKVITTSADWGWSVYAMDLDGDGDMDVLSASNGDDKIAWYENRDGRGSFGSQQVITTSADGARSVHAADLDGDGDKDVLSASIADDKIAWYENHDGQGNYGPQQTITTTALSVKSVYVADLDGDSDLDVLSASNGDDKIAWYENQDGRGSFGSQHVITTSVDWAISVHAADLDGDSDCDVLSASLWDDKIVWYENRNGHGSFGPLQVITTSADGAASVYTTDLDGDGDLDVLSASHADDKIAWYENRDGRGSFGPQQVITTSADGAISVLAADLDGNGDPDVLSASDKDDKIAWYYNRDGHGSFGPQQVITTSAAGNAVYAADLDGDGDVDVLSASYDDGNIAWYENRNGRGGFGPQQVITISADGATDVYAADLDGDDDVDVLSASSKDNKIAWYENRNGQGSFGTQQVITTSAKYANSVYAADLDGDGDLDVLSASGNDDKIAWYRNDSQPRTAKAPEIRVVQSIPDSGEATTAYSKESKKDTTVSPKISLSKTTLNFGELTTENLKELTINVSNLGSVDLVIDSMTFSSNTGDFSLLAQEASLVILTPSDSLPIVISFSPTTGGEKRDTLNIRSNDLTNPNFAVPLMGVSMFPAKKYLTKWVIGLLIVLFVAAILVILRRQRNRSQQAN